MGKDGLMIIASIVFALILIAAGVLSWYWQEIK